jgi:hypothetical protein
MNDEQDKPGCYRNLIGMLCNGDIRVKLEKAELMCIFYSATDLSRFAAETTEALGNDDW